VASGYSYLDDEQRVPSVALPSANGGGAGTLNRLDGTGWYTLDAKAVLLDVGGHEVSFGAHRDAETFKQARYNTADWAGGGAGAIANEARGRTATDALWAQDVIAFSPGLSATLGGRFEHWKAYDGRNYSAAPSLDVAQPGISGSYFSPKAALAWRLGSAWTASAAWGSARRMPTVTELYQAITTGAVLTVPNPDLRPERASTFELAGERVDAHGRLRASLFREDMRDALLSQSAPLVPGSTTLYSYVQNVDRTRSRGIELAFERSDVFVRGLDLAGTLTYVDGRTLRDAAFPAAEGKQLPQLPRWRGSASATWRADEHLSLALAARYSDRAYGTIDNSDPVAQTFQGFGRYFVVDVRAQYRIDRRWSASLGVDNVGNDRYFVFHPFPQRTYLMEIRYASN
jgi:iron complex outermembrane receptor protein